MALTDFRLSPDQSNGGFVVILADDGKMRAITHVAREAVEIAFNYEALARNRGVELLERNLVAITEIIKRKYAAGETAPYTDRIGMIDPNNKLITVTTADLAGIATA
jgi:hypothetical protein